MSLIHINSENYEKEVLNAEKPVLLDFYADWCAPCGMLAPFIAEIAEEHPEYTIGKINVDEQSELTAKFGISSIPALFVLKNGEVTANLVGFTSKEKILEMFN